MACYMEDDDAFGDEFEDDRVIYQNEWSRNASARVKEGYRDGLEAGQDVKLQEGFNEGYKNAALYSAEIPRLKGCVSAILSYGLVSKDTLLTKEASTELEFISREISLLQEESAVFSSLTKPDHSTSQLSSIKSMAEKLGLLDVKTKTSINSERLPEQGETEENMISEDCVSKNSAEKFTAGENLADHIDSRGTTLQDQNYQVHLREITFVKDKLNRLLTSLNLQHIL